MNSVSEIRAASKVFMSQKERAKYSICRAILAAGSPKYEPCLEREVSEAYRREYGAYDTSFVIPPEIVFGESPQEARAASRVLSAVNPPAGGYTVGQQVAPLISYLYPQSVVMRLGASMAGGFGLPGTVKGNVNLPRVSGSDEGEWLAEGETPGANHESNFGGAVAMPRRIYAGRRISKQLLVQNGLGEEMVKSLLMGALAAAVDRGALVGTGGKQPIGLLNDPNVPTISLGSNGGVPTLAKLNETEGSVVTARVPFTSPGWAISANARLALKSTVKNSNGGAYLLETVNDVDRVNGFSAYATAFMSDSGAKGSGSNLASAIFSAAWEYLQVIGWGGLDIIADPHARVREGEMEIAMNGYFDVAKLRPEAFAKVSDMITA